MLEFTPWSVATSTWMVRVLAAFETMLAALARPEGVGLINESLEIRHQRPDEVVRIDCRQCCAWKACVRVFAFQGAVRTTPMIAWALFCGLLQRHICAQASPFAYRRGGYRMNAPVHALVLHALFYSWDLFVLRQGGLDEDL